MRPAKAPGWVIPCIGLFTAAMFTRMAVQLQPSTLAIGAGTVAAATAGALYARALVNHRRKAARVLAISLRENPKRVGWLGHAVLFVLTLFLSFLTGSHGLAVTWTFLAGEPAVRQHVVESAKWHEGGRRSLEKRCYVVRFKGQERYHPLWASRPCFGFKPPKGSILMLAGAESAWGFIYTESGESITSAP